uniref:Uncharacterized protein n=1 Tax=Panagrolaimus sp. PS1159 TaxID=55785 RepID=A0AC35FQV4_9BILA
MLKQVICLLIVFTLLTITFAALAAPAVIDPSAINDEIRAVTGNPPNSGRLLKNGKKGEWRRKKFPKPAEAKTFDDHADADNMEMDKRSFYGDYGYYYYYCG